MLFFADFAPLRESFFLLLVMVLVHFSLTRSSGDPNPDLDHDGLSPLVHVG